MKLKSFNFFISLLIICLFSPVMSEDKIDIWKDNKDSKLDTIEKKNEKIEDKLNIKSSQTIKATEKIQIEEGSAIIANEQKVYGIYEPATIILI